MTKKILLIGSGGHCKSVLDALLTTKEYSDIALIDKKENIGKDILSVPIIGSDEDLPKLFQSGFHYGFITIGGLGSQRLRNKLFKELLTIGFEIPNIFDETAIISNHTTFEQGIFVGKKAVINAGATIKKGAIINTSSLIEHDCVIGEFSHIAPGSILCGDVQVGKYTHIGAGSAIKQQIKIGSNTVIGMGSTVISDIQANSIAFGTPCKEVNSR